MAHTIRVLMVDDHRMFLEALKMLLANEDDMEVLDAVETAERALELCRASCPEVVLMDLDLPGKDGIQATREIREMCPNARVIVITALQQPETIAKAVEAGASGYLLKTRAADELLNVIRQAAAGEIVMPASQIPLVLGRLQQTRRAKTFADLALGQLTSREVQILQAFAEGKSTQDVARALHISRLTVQSHVKNILFKLGVHSKLEAVTFAVRHGFIEIPRAV